MKTKILLVVCWLMWLVCAVTVKADNPVTEIRLVNASWTNLFVVYGEQPYLWTFYVTPGQELVMPRRPGVDTFVFYYGEDYAGPISVPETTEGESTRPVYVLGVDQVLALTGETVSRWELTDADKTRQAQQAFLKGFGWMGAVALGGWCIRAFKGAASGGNIPLPGI